MLQLLEHHGSGKSTLLHLIGGVDRPSSGKVFIDGKDIYKFNNDELAIFRRRQVGLIYQFYNLIPILNVEENITLPLNLDNKEVNKEKLNELIKLLGLENRRSHLPNELSGGQQQRTSIGRALITNPSIILADEPTGSSWLCQTWKAYKKATFTTSPCSTYILSIVFNQNLFLSSLSKESYIV